MIKRTFQPLALLLALSCGGESEPQLGGTWWSEVECVDRSQWYRVEDQCTFIEFRMNEEGQLFISDTTWSEEHGTAYSARKYQLEPGQWELQEDRIVVTAGDYAPDEIQIDQSRLKHDELRVKLEPLVPDNEPAWTGGRIWIDFTPERSDEYPSP